MLPDDGLKDKGPGRSDNGNVVLTNVLCAVHAKDTPPQPVRFRSATADFAQKEFQAEKAIDADPKTGWAIYPEVGDPHWLVLELEQPIPAKSGEIEVAFEFQSQFSQHQPGRVRLSSTDSSAVHSRDSLPKATRQIVVKPANKRSAAEQQELRIYYRSEVSRTGSDLARERTKLKEELAQIEKTVPTAMVMSEMPQPRDTFILVRGQYDKKGEKVTAQTPSSLPPFRKGSRPIVSGWRSGSSPRSSR